MTVATDTCVATYAGNGQQTEFPFDFKIFEETDLKLAIRTSSGEETVPDGGDYEVSGAGDPNGGSVTYPLSGQPLPPGATITLYRELPFTQDLELVENDPFPATLIERQFDRSVMRDQQILDRLERSLAYSVATPEEERLTPSEYVEALRRARESAQAEAVLAENEYGLALEAASRASSDAERAFAQADRAAAAALDVEGMAMWWSALSVAAVRGGETALTAPENLESLFVPGRAVRLSPTDGSAPATGHVVRAIHDGIGSTAVTVTCPVPSAIGTVEYGQAVDNAPRPAPSAIAPEISGPSTGNELNTREFTVLRADGSEYTDEVRIFLQATRNADGADISGNFTLSMPDNATIRLTLPPVSGDLAVTLRFRVSEGVLGYSDWSAPLDFMVKNVPLTADDGAVFEATATDWPIQETGAACSKTVGQGTGELDWTKRSGSINFDATADDLAVDSYSGGTLVCTDVESRLTGPWAFKPAGSDTCVVTTDEPTETSNDNLTEYESTCTPGSQALTSHVWVDVNFATTGLTADITRLGYAVGQAGTYRLGLFVSPTALTPSGGSMELVATATLTHTGGGDFEYAALDTAYTPNSGYYYYVAPYGVGVNALGGTGSNGACYIGTDLTVLGSYTAQANGTAGYTPVTALATGEIVYIYTWTGRTESSIEKVYQLPKTYLATGGEGELLTPETELEVVSHSGTALTVKFPTALTGLFGGGTERQHTGLTLNGSIAATAASAGDETDVAGETFEDSRTCNTNTNAGVTSLVATALPNGATITHLGLWENTGISAELGIYREDATNIFTRVASANITHTGNSTFQSVALATPYAIPATGNYHIGAYSASTIRGFIDGPMWWYNGNAGDAQTTFSVIGYQQPKMSYATSVKQITLTLSEDPGATITSAVKNTCFTASAETPSSCVRSDLTVGEETHDKLTVTTSERSPEQGARSVAICVERPLASGNQTYDATINLWKGDA